MARTRRPPEPGTRVHVLGLGRSGMSACLLASRIGCEVSATDRKDREQIPAADDLERAGIRLDLGGHDPGLFRRADLVVVSPGVPDLPVIAEAERAGVEVIGEVELAWRCSTASVVGVTGSNGKSTVTSMVGAALAASPVPVWTGGNLGTPLSDAVGSPADREDGVFVVELSSFQLERIRGFRAAVATVLNVTPDHLDRYRDLDHYAATKGRIFDTQEDEDHAVVLRDEPGMIALAARSAGTIHVVGGDGDEVTMDGERIAIRGLAGIECHVAREDLGLTDDLAWRNGVVALGLSLLAGAELPSVAAGFAGFRSLPHRFETVADRDGVRWIDDSKATNPASVVAALRAAGGPVILIAGGLDKKLDYDVIATAAQGRIRRVLLIGQAAEAIAGALSGRVEVEMCGDLETAVDRAGSLARSGDVVLLSPACASFDQFRSFEHRGQEFRKLVLERLDGSGCA